MDSACKLCCYNPKKRCIRQLNHKFLTHEPLQAACGAHLKLQIVSSDGCEVSPDVFPDLHIQVSYHLRLLQTVVVLCVAANFDK